MDKPLSTRQLARGLRARVHVVEDDRFVTTLAQVARHAPVPAGRTTPVGLRLAAASAAVTLTVLGAAYAADVLSVGQPSDKAPADHTRILDPAESPDEADTSVDPHHRQHHATPKRHHAPAPAVPSTSAPSPEPDDDASVAPSPVVPGNTGPSQTAPQPPPEEPADTDDQPDTSGSSGSGTSGTSGSDSSGSSGSDTSGSSGSDTSGSSGSDEPSRSDDESQSGPSGSGTPDD